MKTSALPVLALALLAACGSAVQQNRAPLDRIYFPTGIAIAPKPGGGDLLYVVNSNFDLGYAADDGGTLLAIDPDASTGPEGEIAPAKVVGAVRIPSYGGGVAIAHPGVPGCEGIARTTAVVPVRYTNEIFAIDVGADGALTCGEGCRIPAAAGTNDPFGVAVACRQVSGATRQSAFVTHLRAPPVSGAPAGDGFVTEIDLGARAAGDTVNLGAGPTSTVAYDAARGILFTGPAVGALGYAPVRFWRPRTVGADGQFEYTTTDVNQLVPYSIVRGMALSSDGAKVYVAADLYDASTAVATGGIRVTGAVLMTLDVISGALGGTTLRLTRVTPIGGGSGPIAIVPRPGRNDLVVLTDTAGSEVRLYDDDAGALVAFFGRDDVGRPLIREPYGIASQALPGGAWRVWIGSFRDGTLNAIDIADPSIPGTARITKRIGNAQ